MSSLIERDRSVLVVIDVQRSFLDQISPEVAGALLRRIAWLLELSHLLEIPVVAMGEDLEREGPLHPDVQAALPPATRVHDKRVFGLAGQEDIRHTLESLHRDTIILTGLETDVCIAHSALGLIDRGHRVVVIEDACASPPPHHEAGLRRMRDAGVLIMRTKGLAYEWMRDLATLERVKQALAPCWPPP